MWGFPLEGALPASGSWLGAAFPAAALASPRPLCLIYLKLFNQNLCLRTLVSMAQLPGFFFFNYFMSTAWDGLNCQGLEAGLQRYFNYI